MVKCGRCQRIYLADAAAANDTFSSSARRKAWPAGQRRKPKVKIHKVQVTPKHEIHVWYMHGSWYGNVRSLNGEMYLFRDSVIMNNRDACLAFTAMQYQKEWL